MQLIEQHVRPEQWRKHDPRACVAPTKDTPPCCRIFQGARLTGQEAPATRGLAAIRERARDAMRAPAGAHAAWSWAARAQGWMVALGVLWACLSLRGISVQATQAQFGPQCEEIKIPMCRNMPYNLTRLPNLLHHSTQENAQLAIDQFELLRWTKCSDQLEFFLCSMYAPICTVDFATEAVPPCRSVCEASRDGCEPLLRRFNIPWPESLECAHLPVYDRGVCITPEAIITAEASPQPEVEEGPCECLRRPKLREKIYKKRDFDYVLRGTVQSVDTFGGLTLTTVLVSHVVRAGRVRVLAGESAHLWTNRSCACPPLALAQDSLLLGWEDFANSRLLYLEGSIVVPYRKRYVKKIQAWDGFTWKPPTATPLPTLPSPNITISGAMGGKSRPHPPSIQVGNSRRGKKNRSDRRRRRKERRRRRKSKSRRLRKKQQNGTDTPVT